jgi:phosphoserine phosphatase RsbU/P
MAIENDRLQRETLERGRLEREMQLARDIQRTFLPSQAPSLPGWELDFAWSTAREVGGDFYDYFELPGNRLGVVIADVADKGMPAALFMTEVRTLMRATVQSVASPTQALAHINNVLVPDAQGGMFVTIIYAVIDLANGTVTCANAGHNPPLWLHHQSQQLQRLPIGGTALGIDIGSPIIERTFTMQAGDFLVLYTDGITEAFSPTGDMYGEERLMNAIVAAASEDTLTAKRMIIYIDTVVKKFMSPDDEDVAFADDMTSLVLKRLGT